MHKAVIVSLAVMPAAIACGRTETSAVQSSSPPETVSASSSASPSGPKAPQKLLDGFNAHDAQNFASAYAADATVTTYGACEYQGRTAIAEHMAAFFKAYPDARAGIARVWRAGDVDVVEWVVTGTSLGDGGSTRPGTAPVQFVGASVFIGPLKASKKRVGFIAISALWRNSQGLVTKEHAYCDSNTPLLQLDRGEGDSRPLANVPVRTAVYTSQGSAVEANNLGLHKRLYALPSDSKAEALAILADNLGLEDYGDPDARKGLKGEAARGYFVTSPERQREVLSAIASEDFTLVEEAAHTSVANKQLIMHSLDVIRWSEGKAVEAWTYSNSKEIFDQILSRLPTGGH